MKLDEFYRRIGPYLEGRVGHAEAVDSLYSGDGGVDARRLAIYGRFCRIHRHQVLEGVFAHVHAAFAAREGQAAWKDLVHEYFVAHPMRHFELNENGAEFPAFLVARADERGWPAWLAELADFEWWEWLSKTVPDARDTDGGGEGPGLSLGRLVELRAYGHDLCGWLDHGPGPSEGEPASTPTHVLFWRDRDLDGRRATASPLELLLLKWVFEGQPVPLADLAPDLDPAALTHTLDDLFQAGILDGELP
jgi:hypothetical protein